MNKNIFSRSEVKLSSKNNNIGTEIGNIFTNKMCFTISHEQENLWKYECSEKNDKQVQRSIY